MAIGDSYLKVKVRVLPQPTTFRRAGARAFVMISTRVNRTLSEPSNVQKKTADAIEVHTNAILASPGKHHNGMKVPQLPP